MAFTWTVNEKTTFGNMHVQMGVVTADAATGTFDTGLGNVRHVTVAPKSVTTAAYKVARNAGVSGTSTVGTVAITGVVSGDEFFVTVFGS